MTWTGRVIAARAAGPVAALVVAGLVGGCAATSAPGGEAPVTSVPTVGADVDEPPALAPGASAFGAPEGVDVPADAVAGVVRSTQEDLVHVLVPSAASCPVLADAEAQVDDAEARVPVVRVDLVEPGDAGCGDDVETVTTVVALPDGVDHAGEMDVVVGGLGTVRLPAADAGGPAGTVAGWVPDR